MRAYLLGAPETRRHLAGVAGNHLSIAPVPLTKASFAREEDIPAAFLLSYF